MSDNSLSKENIDDILKELYGSYDILDKEVRQFIENVIAEGHYQELYDQIRKAENDTKNILLEYQRLRPRSLNSDNINEIISILQKRKNDDPK